MSARHLLGLLLLVALVAGCAPCASPDQYFCQHPQQPESPQRRDNGGM